MAKYSLPITKPISPWWASRPIFLQNLPSSARLLPASDVVWRRVAMHNDRLISDEEFPLLASFMLVDMTIAPLLQCGLQSVPLRVLPDRVRGPAPHRWRAWRRVLSRSATERHRARSAYRQGTSPD